MSQESADAFAWRIKQEKEFREIFDKIKDDKELYYKKIKQEGYDFTVEGRPGWKRAADSARGLVARPESANAPPGGRVK